MDFYKRTTPKARKNHKCELCRETILPGQSYSKEVGTYQGDFYTRDLCMTCYDMTQAFVETTKQAFLEYSDVEYFLQDNFCQDCPYGDCCHFTCRCPRIRAHFRKKPQAPTVLVCFTPGLATKLFQALAQYDCSWIDSQKIIDCECTYWNQFGKKTCYYITESDEGLHLSYFCRDEYTTRQYDVIECSKQNMPTVIQNLFEYVNRED